MCERIRDLNDAFRRSFTGGRVVCTQSVALLPIDEQFALFDMVQNFCLFDEDNDPHKEHDCASFDYNGNRYMFKIDYYDPSFEFHSENPADPKVTQRVLTIMHASDY